MSAQPASALVDLDDTDLTVASPEDDVRGKSVVDRDGEDAGEVAGLLIDEEERRVRFLKVASGGFLGIGEEKRLIPVDAVTGVGDRIQVDTTREHIEGSPAYDPEIVRQESVDDFYARYGAPPFWTPGYAYPAFPFSVHR